MNSIIQPCCCCCCKQNLGSSQNFYIEVTNQSPVFLNFILGYFIAGKRVMKPSSPFGPGKSERMVFPGTAQRLCLRIFDTSFNPPKIICSRFPASDRTSGYKVTPNAIGVLQCTNV